MLQGELEIWAGKATQVPHNLSQLYPHLIHVEERSLGHPNWDETEISELYRGHYNWSGNYAVHVWGRNRRFHHPRSPADIDRLDSTLGEICRLVLYGSKTLRPTQTVAAAGAVPAATPVKSLQKFPMVGRLG